MRDVLEEMIDRGVVLPGYRGWFWRQTEGVYVGCSGARFGWRSFRQGRRQSRLADRAAAYWAGE